MKGCKKCQIPERCLDCETGYELNTITQQCHERCSKLGYKIKPGTIECQGRERAECVEICGDGRNLGQVECDDGGNVDGDGCSKDCKIEPGFICITNSEGLDKCRDVIDPTAILNVLERNQLRVAFSEPVLSIVNGIINIAAYICHRRCPCRFDANETRNCQGVFSAMAFQRYEDARPNKHVDPNKPLDRLQSHGVGALGSEIFEA